MGMNTYLELGHTYLDALRFMLVLVERLKFGRAAKSMRQRMPCAKDVRYHTLFIG